MKTRTLPKGAILFNITDLNNKIVGQGYSVPTKSKKRKPAHVTKKKSAKYKAKLK